MILAHETNRRDVCPDCHTPLAIGTSPDWLYDISRKTVCHACEALAEDAKAHERTKHKPGVLRTILPVPRQTEE